MGSSGFRMPGNLLTCSFGCWCSLMANAAAGQDVFFCVGGAGAKEKDAGRFSCDEVSVPLLCSYMPLLFTSKGRWSEIFWMSFLCLCDSACGIALSVEQYKWRTGTSVACRSRIPYSLPQKKGFGILLPSQHQLPVRKTLCACRPFCPCSAIRTWGVSACGSGIFRVLQSAWFCLSEG